jgi:hypothetical protein
MHSKTRKRGVRGKHVPEAHITAAFRLRKCESAHIYVGTPLVPKEKMIVWTMKSEAIKWYE